MSTSIVDAVRGSADSVCGMFFGSTTVHSKISYMYDQSSTYFILTKDFYFLW